MLRRLILAATTTVVLTTLVVTTFVVTSAVGSGVGSATALTDRVTSVGPPPADPSNVPDRLHAGEATTAGLRSPSGHYLLMLRHGLADLVQLGIDNTLTADVWNTQTPPRPANDLRLSMQTDGNLVLSSPAGPPVWSTHTSGTGSNNTLVLQDDGDLVIYDGANQVVWQTHTGPAILDRGSVLASGRLLTYTPPGYLGRTRLIMQSNGDLVLYWGGRAVWTSHTDVPGSRLVLLHNGNLVIYTPANRAVWQSGTKGIRPAGLEVGAALGQLRPGVWYPSDRGYLLLYDTNADQRWIRPVG